MISPSVTPPSTFQSLPIDPLTLALMTSATIFPHVLSFAPLSTLSTCLRVSQSISHMAASILYRDVSLIHLLPPIISAPPSIPDTRSPFWQYVRTLRLPPHLLYDPALCTCIGSMTRLHTVIVPGDWQGWILQPNIFKPIFASPDRAPLRVLVKGLKSPAALINNGLLQSDLLSQANEVILSTDYLNPVYRGPKMRVTAAMGGPRFSIDLPSCIKKLTVLLPKEIEAKDRRPKLPAGFDMGADSGFFHTPHGSGLPNYHGLALELGPDAAPDLAKVLVGRKGGYEVVIVTDVPGVGGEDAERVWKEDERDKAEGSMKELKERTELLVDGILGRQGLEDGTAGKMSGVRWVTAAEWIGLKEVQALLSQ